MRKVEIKPEHHFRFDDGSTVKTLKELALKLSNINDEIFDHHVNTERNDFHNWVKYVWKNNSLAKEILKIKSPKKMSDIISKKILEKKKKNILDNLERIDSAQVIPDNRIPIKKFLMRIKRAF